MGEEEEEVVAGVMGEEVAEAVDVRGIRRRFGEEDMRIVRVFV
jgi:DNA-binding protein